MLEEEVGASDPTASARTVADLVTTAAARRPQRLALVDGARRISWAELERWVEATAQALRASGLAAADRVAVQLPSSLEFVETYLGGLRAGLVVVPVNPTYTRPELQEILAESGARVLVTSSIAALSDAEALRGELPALERVVAVLPGSSAATPPDGTVSFSGLVGAHLGPAGDPGGDPRPEQPPQKSPPGQRRPGEPRREGPQPEDVAVLLFTSGTGGRPKGAMLTHRALLANLRQAHAVTPPLLSAEDVVLLAMPLFHIYGLNAGLGVALAHGSASVLLDRFDLATSLRLIEEERVSVLLGAPAMFAAWAAAPHLAAATSGVRFALSGAAPLPAALVARFAAVGVPLHEGYGLTEAAPAVSSNAVRADGSSRLGEPKAGSVGAALPGVEVSLREPDGEEVDPDDSGLVAVRGANLFSGYWPDGAGGPDADGWFVTGDLAYADDDGDLVLVGRDSEMVLVNGFNVYPTEIEQVIGALDGVADVAVVGVPDETTGEAVIAYVVPAPGAVLDPREVHAGSVRSLARFKWPRRVEVVDSLPHTVTGKVKKWQLPAAPDAAHPRGPGR